MNTITQLQSVEKATNAQRVTEFGDYVVWHKSDEARMTARNIELMNQSQGFLKENNRLREEILDIKNESSMELAHISDLKAQISVMQDELDESRDEVRLLVAEKKEALHQQRKAESFAKQETKRAETKAQRVIRQDKKTKQLEHELRLAKQQAKKVAQPASASKHPTIKLADGAIEIQLAMNQAHIHKATEPQWLVSSQSLDKEQDGAAVFGSDSMELVRSCCGSAALYKEIEEAVNKLTRMWRKNNDRLLTTDLEGPSKAALEKIWSAGFHQAKELALPTAVEHISQLPGIGDKTMIKIKAALKKEGVI